MSDILRLFVGIFPSQSTQIQLNREAKRLSEKLQTEVRLLAPESLHLTIKFIGNIDKNKLDDFTVTFLKATGNLPTASLQIKQLMLFPSPRKPRVLAAEIERSRQLQDIFQFFNQSFSPLGITTEERTFKPHITLARSRRWQREIIAATTLQLIEPITSVALVRSQLSPAGAKYHVIASVEL